MHRLSISLAWEDTKLRLASDGRLLASVAAALIALPLAILGVFTPDSFAFGTATDAWSALLVIVVALVLLLAQLAIVRLAVGPSVSVGDAIVHGGRRLPFYFLAGVLIGIALLIIVAAAGVLLLSVGVSVNEDQVPSSPAAWLILVALIAVYCVAWVRVIAMSAAVASAEAVGPIAIIRRSWDITAGHFWQLLGFGLLFFVGASIALMAIGFVSALVVGILLGPLDPLSVSALIVAIINSILNAAIVTVLTVMLARIYVQLSGRGSIDVSVPSSGT